MVKYVLSGVKIALLSALVIGILLFTAAIILEKQEKKVLSISLYIASVIIIALSGIAKYNYGYDSNWVENIGSKLGMFSPYIGILSDDEKKTMIGNKKKYHNAAQARDQTNFRWH